MKIIKRIAAVLIISLMAVSCLCACGGKSGGTTKKYFAEVPDLETPDSVNSTFKQRNYDGDDYMYECGTDEAKAKKAM